MYFTSIERGKRKNTASPESSRQTNTEAITYSFLKKKKKKKESEIFKHTCIKNYIMKHSEKIFSFSIFPLLHQQEKMYNFFLPSFYIIKVLNRVGLNLLSIKMFFLKDIFIFLDTKISGLL